MLQKLVFGLLAVAILVIGAVALAAGTSATLSWQMPTQRIDGSPLVLSDIKEIWIRWRRPGSTTVVGSVRVPAPAVTTVVNNLVCGKFEFTATTVLNDADTSDQSTAAPYDTAVKCKPNPPGGLGAA